LAHIPSQFYYAYGNVFFNWVGMASPAAKMTLGQGVEVLCMFVLPAVLLRLSIGASIAVGMATWTVRFALLTAGSDASSLQNAMLYAAIMLHGAAFTLVTISLQLDVDRCAGRRRRATAQGLLSVATLGIGSFLGALTAGVAGARWLPEEIGQATSAGWRQFWLAPGIASAAIMVIALIALPRDKDLRHGA
jgi:hypothetical protein